MDPVPSGQGESKILFEVESCDVLGFALKDAGPSFIMGRPSSKTDELPGSMMVLLSR